jgi:hypothetical protein
LALGLAYETSTLVHQPRSTIVSTSYNTPDDIDDYSDFAMPFGKYVDQPIADVPSQYLRWMYAKCSFLYYPELQRAIEARLGLPPDPVIRLGPPPAADAGQSPPVANHGQTNGHVARPAQPETGVGYLRQIFDRTRRELQLEHQDDPDALQLVDEILARVQNALGI